ncbi:MAG: hypothetical protein KBA06_00210 [Saprospiraceae bacterium]|nr:hypothetical protein [Saprospiraceae bacterium]
MYHLDEKYLLELEEIAQQIQASENLNAYLEEEEEEFYRALQEEFEPKIAVVYDQLASENPMQLVAFERTLLNTYFEGLFLPKILGYSVLRPEIDNNYKYVRPNDHFKEILTAICESSNFEIIRKRIGQSIQIGFALSSDIWITNYISTIENKKIRNFLIAQKIEKYRDLSDRKEGFNRFKKQFNTEHFYTADFPENLSELKSEFTELRAFLVRRISGKMDNSSIKEKIHDLVFNKEFIGHEEHLFILFVYANFFDRNESEQKELYDLFEKISNEDPNFEDKYFDFLIYLNQANVDYDSAPDFRMAALLNPNKENNILKYYKLMCFVHSKGYTHDEAIDAVRIFYNQHPGLSKENRCVRNSILKYVVRFAKNISTRDYREYFQLTKIVGEYMKIFSNQQFNQTMENLSMEYINKALTSYTDKRGRDYQDIKRYVSSGFVDLGFLKEKEVSELFKTRRKKKD